MDWRLIGGFSGVGAYFLARLLGTSVSVSIGIAVVLGVVVYTVGRTLGGGHQDPRAGSR